MFGWVPSEGWIVVGCILMYYMGKELIISSRRNKYNYYLRGCLAAFVCGGAFLILREFTKLNIKIYFDNLFMISMFAALILLIYGGYIQALDAGDKEKADALFNNGVQIFLVLSILIIIRLLIM